MWLESESYPEKIVILNKKCVKNKIVNAAKFINGMEMNFQHFIIL